MSTAQDTSSPHSRTRLLVMKSACEDYITRYREHLGDVERGKPSFFKRDSFTESWIAYFYNTEKDTERWIAPGLNYKIEAPPTTNPVPDASKGQLSARINEFAADKDASRRSQSRSPSPRRSPDRKHRHRSRGHKSKRSSTSSSSRSFSSSASRCSSYSYNGSRSRSGRRRTRASISPHNRSPRRSTSYSRSPASAIEASDPQDPLMELLLSLFLLPRVLVTPPADPARRALLDIMAYSASRGGIGLERVIIKELSGDDERSELPPNFCFLGAPFCDALERVECSGDQTSTDNRRLAPLGVATDEAWDVPAAGNDDGKRFERLVMAIIKEHAAQSTRGAGLGSHPPSRPSQHELIETIYRANGGSLLMAPTERQLPILSLISAIGRQHKSLAMRQRGILSEADDKQATAARIESFYYAWRRDSFLFQSQLGPKERPFSGKDAEGSYGSMSGNAQASIWPYQPHTMVRGLMYALSTLAETVRRCQIWYDCRREPDARGVSPAFPKQYIDVIRFVLQLINELPPLWVPPLPPAPPVLLPCGAEDSSQSWEDSVCRNNHNIIGRLLLDVAGAPAEVGYAASGGQGQSRQGGGVAKAGLGSDARRGIAYQAIATRRVLSSLFDTGGAGKVSEELAARNKPAYERGLSALLGSAYGDFGDLALTTALTPHLLVSFMTPTARTREAADSGHGGSRGASITNIPLLLLRSVDSWFDGQIAGCRSEELTAWQQALPPAQDAGRDAGTENGFMRGTDLPSVTSLPLSSYSSHHKEDYYSGLTQHLLTNSYYPALMLRFTDALIEKMGSEASSTMTQSFLRPPPPLPPLLHCYLRLHLLNAWSVITRGGLREIQRRVGRYRYWQQTSGTLDRRLEALKSHLMSAAQSSNLVPGASDVSKAAELTISFGEQAFAALRCCDEVGPLAGGPCAERILGDHRRFCELTKALLLSSNRITHISFVALEAFMYYYHNTYRRVPARGDESNLTYTDENNGPPFPSFLAVLAMITDEAASLVLLPSAITAFHQCALDRCQAVLQQYQGSAGSPAEVDAAALFTAVARLTTKYRAVAVHTAQYLALLYVLHNIIMNASAGGPSSSPPGVCAGASVRQHGAVGVRPLVPLIANAAAYSAKARWYADDQATDNYLAIESTASRLEHYYRSARAKERSDAEQSGASAGAGKATTKPERTESMIIDANFMKLVKEKNLVKNVESDESSDYSFSEESFSSESSETDEDTPDNAWGKDFQAVKASCPQTTTKVRPGMALAARSQILLAVSLVLPPLVTSVFIYANVMLQSLRADETELIKLFKAFCFCHKPDSIREEQPLIEVGEADRTNHTNFAHHCRFGESDVRLRVPIPPDHGACCLPCRLLNLALRPVIASEFAAVLCLHQWLRTLFSQWYSLGVTINSNIASLVMRTACGATGAGIFSKFGVTQ